MPTRPPSRQAAPAEILANLSLGYNGYTDPTATKPQMWAPGSLNVFSGAFQNVQRARFANVVSGLATGLPFTTLRYFAIPAGGAWLIADRGGKLFSYDTSAAYAVTQRLNPYIDPLGAGDSRLNGPWSRETLQSILYEMNGQVKQAGRGANAATIEGWGLDAPDSTAQVAVTAGATATFTSISRSNNIVTASSATLLTPPGVGVAAVLNITGVSDATFNGSFLVTITGSGPYNYSWSQLGQNSTPVSGFGSATTSITKAVGRSYTWAWENAGKAHVGAPAPVTQYILYTSQNGTLSLVEPGTISVSGSAGSSATVTGTNTFFTAAWIGRSIWAVGAGVIGRVTAVANAVSMTVQLSQTVTVASQQFQVFDPQATHLRIYAPSDGGATYFRIARNVWQPLSTTLAGSGLQYLDAANAEPPAFPFTTETAQQNNVPPPVGAFVNEYQGVLIVYGVPGALQSFFYSNQTATSIGLLQESFAPLNQVTLPLANAQLNGMLEFPGSLILWSDKQDMFRLTGLLTDNTVGGVAAGTAASQQGASIARLPYALGSATPFAADITPLGGFWLTSNREIWLYTDRYAPRNIGRPVQDILNSISPSALPLARARYYHTSTRNWMVFAVAAGGAPANNTLLILDLDLLASNGSPSYFTFDMATNSPSWYVYQPGTQVAGAWLPRCDSLEVVYEAGGLVRLLVGQVDLVQDVDFAGGIGTEIAVPNGRLILHAWGNDTAFLLKRPTWLRFNTNRDPSVLSEEVSYPIASVSRVAGTATVTTAGPHGLQGGLYPDTVFVVGTTDPSFRGAFAVQSTPSNTTFTILQPGLPNASSSGGAAVAGWSFAALGIDDDFYTFNSPLVLSLASGLNDSSALSGNPDFSGGLAFRHSPELFRIGGVNFVMGRRVRFVIDFPSGAGTNYQLRSVQVGFGVNPPS